MEDEQHQAILYLHISWLALRACQPVYKWTARFYQVPYLEYVRMAQEVLKKFKHTITKNPVQLVLGQERQPVNAFLLVFAELRLDRNRYGVLFNFAAI